MNIPFTYKQAVNGPDTLSRKPRISRGLDLCEKLHTEANCFLRYAAAFNTKSFFFEREKSR